MIPVLSRYYLFYHCNHCRPPVSIDGIREPVEWFSTTATTSICPCSGTSQWPLGYTCTQFGKPVRLMNGSTTADVSAVVFHFLIGSYMADWELSYRLGMRPWIFVAYSAPVAAASAVFLVYPFRTRILL